MGPAPPSPCPVGAMVDEHLSVYLGVLKRHREKPFIRLTAYGALEFLTAVAGDGALRFERDGQPSDIFSFSSNGNGVSLPKVREERREEFRRVWEAYGPKASLAPAADGPREDFEKTSTSLRAAWLHAMQIIVHSIPGVRSLWMTTSKEGKIFRLLTSMETKLTTDLQKRISPLSDVHIQGEKRYIPKALRPGTKTVPTNSYTWVDPVAPE